MTRILDAVLHGRWRIDGPQSRPAGGGFKPPHAALAEDRRGERRGRGARDASGGDQEGERKRIVADVPKHDQLTSKPGSCTNPGMNLAGARLLAGGVRHIDDASLICCFRAEREKARPDTAALAGGEREFPGRLEPCGSEYPRGARRGPARSSGEAPVMGAE